MALATADIAYDISNLLGAEFWQGRSKATIVVKTNIVGDAIVDTEANQIRLGSTKVDVDATGTGTIALWIPGVGSNPVTWQYSFQVNVPDAGRTSGRLSHTFGPFTITQDADLADLIAEMPVQPEYASALTRRIDGAEDHGNVSGAVTLDCEVSTHWLDAIGPTVLTITDGPPTGTRYVTVLPLSGASDILMAEPEDAELADGTFSTFAWVRGAWMLATGGSSGPADTTPPSAITDLAATGGESQIVLTGTTPTDAESTARIRYRVWLTSGGASGAWSTANAFPITVTGLPAGNYTAEAYAYSAGGATVPDTATAAVTAPVQPYRDVVLDLNPLYYYPLDDAPGTTEPLNLGSGAGAAGVVTGVTFGAAGLGDGITSADFTNGRIDLPTAANLNGATSLTVCALVRCNVASDLPTIAGGGNDASDGWVLGSKYSGIEGNWAGTASSISTYLVAMTWDGTTIKVYKNNAAATQTYAGAISTTEPQPRLGSNGGGNWPWEGSIAGFFILAGTAIAPEQIAALVASAGL